MYFSIFFSNYGIFTLIIRIFLLQSLYSNYRRAFLQRVKFMILCMKVSELLLQHIDDITHGHIVNIEKKMLSINDCFSLEAKS